MKWDRRPGSQCVLPFDLLGSLSILSISLDYRQNLFSVVSRNSVLATICKKLFASGKPFSTDSTSIRAGGAGVTCISSY